MAGCPGAFGQAAYLHDNVRSHEVAFHHSEVVLKYAGVPYTHPHPTRKSAVEVKASSIPSTFMATRTTHYEVSKAYIGCQTSKHKGPIGWKHHERRRSDLGGCWDISLTSNRSRTSHTRQTREIVDLAVTPSLALSFQWRVWQLSALTFE